MSACNRSLHFVPASSTSTENAPSTVSICSQLVVGLPDIEGDTTSEQQIADDQKRKKSI
jgi:hypothetical protein